LFGAIVDAWIPHITATQVPNVVSGLKPIRSMVNIGSGMADLVLLPIEQYRRDGRVVKGLRRGMEKFIRTAAMETLQIGTKLAVGAQIILEHADSILAPASSSTKKPNPASRYAASPRNLSDGMGKAVDSLSLHVGTAIQTIVAVPVSVEESPLSSSTGPVRLIRAVPVAVLRPMIGASEALRNIVMGLRHSIDPTHREHLEEKYKPRRRK
jgi:hypothetical protein